DDLPLTQVVREALDLMHDALQRIRAHRPFLAGKLETAQDLPPIERFPPAVLLNHLQAQLFDLFVSGEPPFASQAPASPLDRFAVTDRARVEDVVFQKAAVGAFHRWLRPWFL